MAETLSRELRKLEDFLSSQAVDDETMLLPELDGFQAGLIVCPDPIKPDEWLPLVWGDDHPVFDDESHAQAIVTIIMDRYNAIGRELDRRRFRPLFDIAKTMRSSGRPG